MAQTILLGCWDVTVIPSGGGTGVTYQLVVYGLDSSTYWWYDHTVSPPSGGAIGGALVEKQITVTNLLDGNPVNFAGTVVLNEDGTANSFSATDNTSGATLAASRARYTLNMPSELSEVDFTDDRLDGAENGPYSTWMFFPDDSYAVVASSDHKGNMLLNEICELDQPDSDHTSFTFTLKTDEGNFAAGDYTFTFPTPPSNDPGGFGGNVDDPLIQRPEGDDDGWMATSKPGT